MTTLALVSLVTALLWAPSPLGRTDSWYGDRNNIYATSARELLTDIPADAVVSANYRLTPQLAYREEIYQFPVPFRVSLYGPDTSLEGSRLDERAERVEYVMIPVDQDAQLIADWLAIADAFDEVARNEIWVLYERNRSIALPGSPLQQGSDP